MILIEQIAELLSVPWFFQLVNGDDGICYIEVL